MKNIKLVFAVLVMGLAANTFGSYLYSWKLYTNVPGWYDWDYAQIAVYTGNERVSYLYEASAPTYESRSYSSDLWNDSSAPAVSAIQDAWVAAASRNDYTYVVELYNASGTFVASSIYYTYDMLLAGYLQGEGTGSADPGTKKITYLIPEPTSALLLLVGMGLLALRRKRAKCLVAMFAMCLVGLSAMAEAKLTFVTLKSEGPDRYADGTVVADGERYALVYAADKSAVVFEANGTVRNGTLVLTARIAKDGACPETTFQLGEAVTAGCTGGEYALFVLDTRLANGTISSTKDGKVAVVNGYALAEGGQVTATVSALPAGIRKPRFTNIEVLEDSVVLTLDNTDSFIQYTVDAEGAEAKNGDENAPITITVPKRDDGQIFRLERK